jgi:hypothetical protein
MTTTTTNGAATKGAAAKGFGALPCPCCGEAQATITLDLTDLEGFHCRNCDADFAAADVRAFIERWTRVLAWIDGAASLQEGGQS